MGYHWNPVAHIRVKTGQNKGKLFPISDAALTIGREENQVIQILDQGVSRAHAQIFHIGEMCFVRDNGSTNGTFVNDVKISEESLKAGDELLIGTTILVFEDPGPGDDQASVEFEGEEGAKFPTTTIELKVDTPSGKTLEKVLGKEVESRNLTLISQVGRILRGERKQEAAFGRIVELVSKVTGADHGFFFLIDREGGRLTPRAVVDRDDTSAETKVSRTIVGRVQKSLMPLLTSDASLDDRFSPAESIMLKKIRSVICVPVLVEERLEGILYFHSNRTDHALSVEDLELTTSVALQLSMAIANAGANERLRRGLMGTIRALVTAMEVVDPEDQGHAQRVADYSASLATQMGLSAEEVHQIRLAALLHDVGKLAGHNTVTGKTVDELDGQHVHAGEQMLTGIEGFEQILPGVRYHHERADGSGFPFKMKNDQLPLMARIIIVTNSFDDACSRGGESGRGRPAKDVVKEMAQRGGKQFDDEVIKALILCHRNGSLYGATSIQP